MKNGLSKISLFILSNGLLLMLVFAFPVKVQAEDVLKKQAPVPTYGSVSSYAETTTATINSRLENQWGGNYTIKIKSLVSYPKLSVNKFLKNIYLGEKEGWEELKTFSHDPKKVYAWTKDIAESVNTDSVEPKLVIKNDRATNFTPPQIGKKLDRYNSTLKILEALEQNQLNIELAVLTTQPSSKLAEINNLGITELIGRGESNFAGSPSNRRHNIKIGVQKMAGVIIKPGEEFSFNQHLGPVEASTGFLPELVIKGNDTIPEFGGGLCQVSSTTFRAIMHAGLPVTQRKNHSYAVQYYAPQGSDATIYPGVIDLKFKNDTENSILIWPYFKTADHLIFDFYGTSDGREVKLNNPVVYDKQSNGAMKATWTRVVTKNGQSETNKFSSIYKPPAEFHQTKEFVPIEKEPKPEPEPIEFRLAPPIPEETDS